MKSLYLLCILSSWLHGQQPSLETRENLSILPNINAVRHLWPKDGGKISLITLDIGAALNPLEVYLIAATGDGPDASVKIWNLGSRFLSIEKIELLPSSKEALIVALVESEVSESNRVKIVRRKVTYLISWGSMENMSGSGGVKPVPPAVKIQE